MADIAMISFCGQTGSVRLGAVWDGFVKNQFAYRIAGNFSE